MSRSQRLYTRQFWFLCGSSVLFFGSFNMLYPELPNYLESFGGEDYKGLIVPMFTLAALISRPFSGRLADHIGRIPVMVFGSVVCMVISLLYPWFTSIGAFMLLRFLHGFSTGFKPTGTAAYLADIVPMHRRGEAMGVLGVFGSMGMAIGPAMGAWVTQVSSLDMMFFTSAGWGLASVLVLVGMRETLPQPQRFRWSLLRVHVVDFYEPRVLGPSITFMLTAFSFGIILTVIPDLSEHVGVRNKGIFYTVFTVASLAVRLLAGKASDRFGRVAVLKVSSLSIVVAMLVIGFVQDEVSLWIGAALFGLAVGMNSPTIFAWTIDLSKDAHRGRAMATMYMALEIGIGGGGLVSALIYDNRPENFGWSFWIGSVLAGIAFFYLLWWSRKRAARYETS